MAFFSLLPGTSCGFGVITWTELQLTVSLTSIPTWWNRLTFRDPYRHGRMLLDLHHDLKRLPYDLTPTELVGLLDEDWSTSC